MRDDVRQDAEWSKKALVNIVWPAIRDDPAVGGGDLLSLEQFNEEFFGGACRGDIDAGFDAMQRLPNNQWRAIANRCQQRIIKCSGCQQRNKYLLPTDEFWQCYRCGARNAAPIPGTWYPYNSITVRTDRESGATTEFEKRGMAVAQDDFLSPGIFVHSYLETQTGPWLSTVIAKVKDVMGILLTPREEGLWSDNSTVDSGGRQYFRVVYHYKMPKDQVHLILNPLIYPPKPPKLPARPLEKVLPLFD